jgi:hypothetical protein
MDFTDRRVNDSKRVSAPVLFREVQKVNQIWVWLIVAIPVINSWYGAYQQLLLGEPFGDNPDPNWMVFLLLLIFGVLFPLFIYFIKLVTEVRKDGLYVWFYPFQHSFKTFPFETIQNYEIRTYNPIIDYGGWGIRHGSKGKAYTITGNRAYFLNLPMEKR